MTALLAAELRRAWSRRLVRVVAIAAFLVIAVAAILTAVNSHGPTEEQLADARLNYQANLEQCLSGAYLPEDQLPPGETMKEFCDDAVRLSSFLPNNEFHLFGLPDIISGASILLILGAMLLGASLVGAEWHAGTMTTLLTWETRRNRVLIAKTIAAAVVTFVLGIVLLAILAGLLWFVAATRGVTAGLPDGFWATVVGGVLRAGAAASFASVIGFAIGMIGRNTAAAIGIGFAYFGVVEQLIRGLRPAWQPALLGENMAIFVSGTSSRLFETLRTPSTAAIVVACYTAALLAVAGLWFRARDVN
ncbi:MAG TPA: ABC transporter permease subunit [Actinomycetota bacterium]|jgi:ABC-type transport system involved in multi-copper enzyme maturation permease subunit